MNKLQASNSHAAPTHPKRKKALTALAGVAGWWKNKPGGAGADAAAGAH